jgi:hypothetical protein
VTEIRVIIDGKELPRTDITRFVNGLIVLGAIAGLLAGLLIARLP